MSTWNVLYRGSLSSCNYDCVYCPFAKTSNTLSELRQDENELAQFVSWVAGQPERMGILFTPWGEALVHGYYRRAMVALSNLTNVYRVSVQTNLAAPLQDFAEANAGKLALWTTFHPTQVKLEQFITRCRELDFLKIRYSVGVVGLRDHFAAIEKLRSGLPDKVYLWINAFKGEPNYYQETDIQWLSQIDPYFHWNLHQYASGGKPCVAGETTFTVDGQGDIRRCHFIKTVLGNIYAPGFRDVLRSRNCSVATCGCHIGYIHRPELRQSKLYGDGLLERIPLQWPEVLEDFAYSGVSTLCKT